MSPQHALPPFHQLTELVAKACGVDPSTLNSCNANLYESRSDNVFWHSDNEPPFGGLDNPITIISLSLGGSRRFQLQRKSKGKIYTAILSHGDIFTMEGWTQKYYDHRIPKEGDFCLPRINLTWRTVINHTPECPLTPSPGHHAQSSSVFHDELSIGVSLQAEIPLDSSVTDAEAEDGCCSLSGILHKL